MVSSPYFINIEVEEITHVSFTSPDSFYLSSRFSNNPNFIKEALIRYIELLWIHEGQGQCKQLTDIKAKCAICSKFITMHHLTRTTHLIQHKKSNRKNQGQSDIRQYMLSQSSTTDTLFSFL